MTDTEGYAVTTDYDAFDRPTVVTFPDSTYSQITYDRLDAVALRDRRGLISKLQYNAIRQLVTSADPLGRLTKYGWCMCGAMRQLIDPDGKQTTWTHDVQGRLTSKIYPDHTVVKYGYENTTSRLKKITDAKGQETNYTYFADNQLDTVSYTNAVIATPSVSYTYETYYPRVHTMVDTVGTTTYAYNAITTTPTLGAGRLATIDGPWANDTISYTYDELGRIATRSINGNANETDLVYDPMGRITSVTNPLGAFAYSYVNATARVDHVIYPNSQRTNYTYYNNAGDQRLQQIENLKPDSSNLSTFAYTYDAQGIIQTWSRQIDSAAALVSSFKYDAADQLTDAVVPVSTSVDKNYVYRYDRAGNRTSEQIDTSVMAASHNNLNQIASMSGTGPIRFEGSIDEAGSVTVGSTAASVAADHSFKADVTMAPGTHTVTVTATDAASNATSKDYSVTVGSGSSRTLTYDLNGNLTNDGAGKTYDWDAADRLVKITQTSGVTEFVYNGLGQRVQEKLAGSEIKRWIWCEGAQPAEERDNSNTVAKRFFGDLGEQIAGAAFFYANDHLGSVREMTDETGAIRSRYAYDSFGRITKVGGDVNASFSFTRLLQHDASGLELSLYRVYDPDLGRWLSRDPIGEKIGINLYTYVGNNPVILSDPLGLDAKITFVDGSSVQVSTVTAFVRAVTGARNGSIQSITFPNTHGNSTTQAIGPTSQAVDVITITPSGIVMVMVDDQSYSNVHPFEDLMKKKMARNSTIALSSCETAKGDENIAKKISELLPSTEVSGNTEKSRWFPFLEMGFGGNPRTYKNGKVLPSK